LTIRKEQFGEPKRQFYVRRFACGGLGEDGTIKAQPPFVVSLRSRLRRGSDIIIPSGNTHMNTYQTAVLYPAAQRTDLVGAGVFEPSLDKISNNGEAIGGIRRPALPRLRMSSSLRLKLEVLFFTAAIGLASLLFWKPDLIALGNWGYLGGFLINTLSAATIFMPAPGIAAIVAMSDGLNPMLLGLVTGIGGAIGSLTAYWAGQRSRSMIEGRAIHQVIEKVMRRFGGLVLFLFSFLAFLPADLASVMAGSTRYPAKRYLMYVGAGNIAKMMLVLYLFERYQDVVMAWIGSF
jgi:membrane protein YqaA with SNARE-associated domain